MSWRLTSLAALFGALACAPKAGVPRSEHPASPPPDEERHAAAVARHFHSRLAELKGCYEEELQKRPQLRGSLALRFTVTTEGRLADLRIEEDSLRDEGVAACLLIRVGAWRLPAMPSEDFEIVYPLHFAPAREQEEPPSPSEGG